MRRFVRTRWLWHSRPVRTWLVVAGIVVIATASWWQAWNQARLQSRQWGRTAPMVTATAPIAAGEPLLGRVTLVLRPAAHAPQGALEMVPDGDQVATRAIPMGAILTGDDVADPSGTPTRPAGGEVAVSIPVDVRTPVLQVGDAVVLISVGSIGLDGRGRSWTGTGRVLAVDDRAATIAVDAGQVTEVAEALGRGSLMVALSASPLPPRPG